jgi:hypothetical protein
MKVQGFVLPCTLIVRHYLRQQCISRGCETLNQLQLLIRISGRANSVLELLLLRLDEQGLDISSPWRISGGDLIVSVLWPKLYAAWLSKEQWAGCREVDEEVLKLWEQAQLCLAACASLGSAEPAILLISQLRGTQTQWLRPDELANRHCHLSPVEHTALTSWLSLLETQGCRQDFSIFSSIFFLTFFKRPQTLNPKPLFNPKP